MAETKDKYGIPPGGNNGPYKAVTVVPYTLPWQELMAAIALAGWPETLWGMAGAVCAAESGRNPYIYNTYKKGHFGLFQISRAAWPQFFSAGPGGSDDLRWMNPVENARQAYAVYKQQGWGAWEAKTNGRYLTPFPAAYDAAAKLMGTTELHATDKQAYWQSLISQKTYAAMFQAGNKLGLNVAANIAGLANSTVGDAVAGAANGVAEGTVASGDAVASSVGDMAQVVTGAWNLLTNPSTWMRLGYGTLGAVLVAGGLLLVIRNQPAVQKAAKTAAAMTPTGATLKAVKGAA